MSARPQVHDRSPLPVSWVPPVGFHKVKMLTNYFPVVFLCVRLFLKGGKPGWASIYIRVECSLKLLRSPVIDRWPWEVLSVTARLLQPRRCEGQSSLTPPSPPQVPRKPRSEALWRFGPGKARSKRRSDRNQDSRGFEGPRTLGYKRKRMHVKCAIRLHRKWKTILSETVPM